ncbi:EamA family transporter [Sorangium sp. So ce1504]|uniref:EamA family transporter n=2 Tax=unclassified Sorangium TaxID=2621164 RepID=UPI003F61EC09
MRFRHVLMAVLTAFVWGLNFVVIKVGLDSFPPLLFSALRFTCAAIPAVFFIDRKQIPWRVILQVGLVLGVVKYSLLFAGIKAGMPAGLSSLAVQAQVLFTLILSAVFLKDAPSRVQKAGIVIALSGIALIGYTRAGSVSLTGFALVLGAAVAWAFANILIKRAGGFDAFRLMVWMSLIPPLPLLGLSLLLEEGQVAAVSRMGLGGLGAVLYTGIIATVVAFGIWGHLLRSYSANLVAPFALLVPVFGMAFSALLLHEEQSGAGVAAAALVLLGLATVVLGPRVINMVAPENRPMGAAKVS